MVLFLHKREIYENCCKVLDTHLHSPKCTISQFFSHGIMPPEPLENARQKYHYFYITNYYF